MPRWTLALAMSALALAPTQAAPPAAHAAQPPPIAIPFPPIPLPPIPLPPIPLPSPTFPLPPAPFPFPGPSGQEAEAHVERSQPYSSDELPFRSFSTAAELAHALTVKRLLRAVRDADDPAATLAALEARLSRSGNFRAEIDRLRQAIDRDELATRILEIEIEIGARPTPFVHPGSDRSWVNTVIESLLPRPLLPLPRPATGWRFGF
ncbi:MAG: hypothetical protein KDD82_24215 [Planctomycetes bacterium]|nr:hypothetical protein [Planctomycetota bacterium]